MPNTATPVRDSPATSLLCAVAEGQYALSAAVRRQQRGRASAAGRLDGLDLLLSALLTRGPPLRLLPDGRRKGMRHFACSCTTERWKLLGYSGVDHGGTHMSIYN